MLMGMMGCPCLLALADEGRRQGWSYRGGASKAFVPGSGGFLYWGGGVLFVTLAGYIGGACNSVVPRGALCEIVLPLGCPRAQGGGDPIGIGGRDHCDLGRLNGGAPASVLPWGPV